MAIFEGFSPTQDTASAKQEALKLASVHSAIATASNGAYIGPSLTELVRTTQTRIHPRIEKVSNGYTVTIDNETFIAENVEAVTGIISAQLLKLGAK
jgi:hypothetical protein